MNIYKAEKLSNMHNRYDGLRFDESFINQFSLLDNLSDFSVSKCNNFLNGCWQVIY